MSKPETAKRAPKQYHNVQVSLMDIENIALEARTDAATIKERIAQDLPKLLDKVRFDLIQEGFAYFDSKLPGREKDKPALSDGADLG